jgi:hypothetical protein
MRKTGQIEFPAYSGVRCLMMPYVQGDRTSVPEQYAAYFDIVDSVYAKKGDIGFLTIDESSVKAGSPHRGARARYARALHTEAGRRARTFGWAGWGCHFNVTLDPDVKVLLANSLDRTCALWDAEQKDTTLDGDIGHLAEDYPYESATFMRAGEVYEIGIFTPHESVPVKADCERQFLRIVSSGVHGREPYFTENPLVSYA